MWGGEIGKNGGPMSIRSTGQGETAIYQGKGLVSYGSGARLQLLLAPQADTNSADKGHTAAWASFCEPSSLEYVQVRGGLASERPS